MKRRMSETYSEDSADSNESMEISLDADTSAEILLAIKNGNWSDISRRISEGMPVDKLLQDDQGDDITMLVASSMHGQSECVKKLIEIGAGKTRFHTKATLLAGKRGYNECFRFLVEAGVCRDVDITHKLSEFLAALKKGEFEVIQGILKESDMKDTVSNWGNYLMSLMIVYGCPTSCLQALIDMGVDVNKECSNSLTPLKCSIFANNVECIRFLIGIGVKFDDVGFAMFCRDDECLELLLNSVAKEQVLCYKDWLYVEKPSAMNLVLKHLDNLDSKDKCGMTFLMWASQKNSIPWAKFLLESGADANHKSSRGDTALSIACKKGYCGMVELLIKYGVNINDQYLETNPSVWQEVPKENMLRKLFDHSAEMGFCSLGESALMIACNKGYDDIVDILIKHGANVNALTPKNNNAVMCAVLSNQVKCLQKLLENQVNINQKNDDGETALMYSCALGYDKIVDMLLKHKADVNAQNEKRKTALMYAALNQNSVKCAQLLLEHKADVHMRNHKGRTALMFSCSHGNVEVLDLLINAGADVNAQNIKGRSAIMYAAVNESESCLQKLLKHVANIDLKNKDGETALMIACIMGLDEVVEFLLKHKANPNVQNDEGKTAIMFAACSRESVKFIHKLLEFGADVNFKTFRGDTALMFACAAGLAEVVEMLVKCGADVNTQNKEGRTAIMFAAGRCQTHCLQTLLNLGADLDVEDEEGQTVFSAALEMDDLGVGLKSLLDSGKLVHENCLKSVHNDAVTGSENKLSIPFQNFLLTMERGIFDWNWCRVASVQLAAYSAVVSGISPGLIDYFGHTVSPLVLAFFKRDVSTIRYLLANLYFLPEDFRNLSKIPGIRECTTISSIADTSNASKAVAEQLFLKPLSLQAWSFLAVSEAISYAGPPHSRTDRVNALPIPAGLKRALKYDSQVSSSCLDDLGEKTAGDLIFNEKLTTKEPDEDDVNYCSHCVSMMEEEDE